MPSVNLITTPAGAWSDDDDGTNVSLSGFSTTAGIADFTIPGGAVVSSVVMKARLAMSPVAGSTPYARGDLSWTGGSSTGGSVEVVNDTNYREYWMNTVAAALDQTQVNSLSVNMLAVTTNFIRCSKVFVTLSYNDTPGTPTWSAQPSALPPSTLRPAHTWNFVSGGAPQSRYRVRVFTLAQATVGGFDPGTSPSTLDTSHITSGASSWTPGSDLSVGTTYRSYVATASTTNGVDQWSGWSAAREFRIVSVPVTSVNNITPDPLPPTDSAAISWTNTIDAAGGAQSRYWVRVFTAAQYGIGGFNPETSPATYESGNLTGAATSLATTALPGRRVTYRAYARVGQTTNGVTHYSGWAFDQFTTGGSSLALPNGTRAPIFMAAGTRAVITLPGGSKL